MRPGLFPKLLVLTALLAPSLHAQSRKWSRQCRGFDICDGRLRQDIYARSFGAGNPFFLADAKWQGDNPRLDDADAIVAKHLVMPLPKPGFRFKVNNFWFEVTDFEWPDIFKPGMIYTIQWERGGYFLTTPAYPGVHVAIKVL